MKIKPFLHHLNLRSTHLLPKFNKTTKIILTICFIFCLSLSLKSILAKTIKIDTTDALQQYSQKQTAIEKGNNQESWINESLISNGVSINQAIGGNLEISNTNNSDGTSSLNWTPGGLIGFTNQSIASLYNPPASGVQYIANSVNSFLGKPTYAAEDSFGFKRLDGILKIWKTMRNTVYTLISLFFIITGIMIMLRVKLSPQAAVTIQSAIPGIISSMILVTFSYAIAGLMIDFSYLVMGLVLDILNSTDTNTLMTMDLLGFSKYLMSDILGWETVGITTVITTIIGAIVASTVASGIMGVLAVVLGLLAVLIIILIQLIKFFFGIAKCYIMLLIHIILGPLEIGMGAIPGSKINFSSWFNEILSNIAVFPISVIFLALMSAIIEACQSGKVWAPPILGNGSYVPFILGLAALFLLSKLPELIPQMIFNIKPSPVGKALSDNTKGLVGIANFGVKSGLQTGANKIQRDYNDAEDLRIAGLGPGATKQQRKMNTLRQVASTLGWVKDK